MHKNIWFLLTAALSLNIAVFADAQEEEASEQMNAIFASNESEDQIKKPILGVDEDEVTKAESLFASNEAEEVVKKPILEADDSDDETDASFIV